MEENNVPSVGVNLPLSPLFPDRIFTPPTANTKLINPVFGTVQAKPSTSSSFENLKASIEKVAVKPDDILLAPNTYFKPADVNYDRYASHPKFKELGFYPHADNEDYYNKNSTLWDDVSRAAPQALNLAGLGLTAGVRSMGNLLSGNPSFDDTALSDEFGNAIAIGQSSRGGLGAWTSNFLLNSSYSIGVIAELAVEEAILGAATGITGGSSAALGALRFAEAGKRLKSAWRALDTADKARDFYGAAKAGTQGALNLLTPNTVTWAKGIKSADNLKDMATLANGFGNFYRDIRTVNLTLDEANMEGGFAFTESRDEMIKSEREKLGRDLTASELETIDELSRQAGFKTRLANVPLIYATNLITFDNAFRGFGKYLSSADDIAKAGGKRLVMKSAKELAEDAAKVGDDALKNIARVEDVSILKDIKSPRKWANLAFKYTKGNLSEGIQELGQEFIQGATIDYYTSIYKDENLREYYGTVYGDKLIASNDILKKSILGSAQENVFSGQGFDTFLQGFLTGGLIGGGTRLTTTLLDKTINKKEAAEKAEKLNQFAKSINESTVSTIDYLDFLNKENLMVQKEAHFDMNVAEAEGDKKKMLDAKAQSVRSNAYNLLVSGNYKYYKSFLEDLKGLTPEEFEKVFKNTTEKGAEKIDELIQVMDQLEKTYNNVNQEFQNPFNPKKYDQKTQKEEYDNELYAYIGFEEEKKKIIFAKDFSAENARRMQKITSNFSLRSVVGDTEYLNYSHLFNEESRLSELVILAGEIRVLEGAEELSPEQKQNLKLKKDLYRRLDILQQNIDVVRGRRSAKKGKFKNIANRDEYRILRNNYEKYLALFNITDKNAIDKSFEELVDYYVLDDESKGISDSLNKLIDPFQILSNSKRGAAIFKEVFANRKKYFEDGAKKHINDVEKNQLILDLAKIGIQPDVDEYNEFMLNGRRLISFYTESGIVPFGSELYKQAVALVEQYEKNTITSNPETAETAVTATGTETEQPTVYSQKDFQTETALIKQEESGEFTFTSGLLNFLGDVVRKLYKDQAARRASENAPEISYPVWLNSKQGLNVHNALLALQERFLTTVDTDKFESLNDAEKEAAFNTWFSTEKSTNFVYDTLNSVGLSSTDITTKYRDRGVFDKSKLKAGENLVSTAPPVNGTFVVSKTVDGVTTFSVVDFENRNVLSTTDEEVLFSSLQDAVDEQVKYGRKNADIANSYVFDGTVFTPGEIWNDGKNTYSIKTKASEMKQDGKLVAINLETGQEKTFRSSKLLLPGKLVSDKDPNRTYLLSLDKYNSVHARREKDQSRQDAQRKLSSLLESTPYDLLMAGLKVVIKPNPNYDKNKKSYLKVDDKAANPYIIEKSPKFIIEIYYNNELVGYLDTLQDVDFIKDNKTIAAKDIDIEMFNNMSNIAGDPVKNFNAFRANLYNGYLLWRNAEALLNSSDTGEVELTGADIEGKLGKFIVSRSQYEYGNASISELAHNTLDGGYFVIDRRPNKQKGSVFDSVRYVTKGYSAEKQRELEEEVESNKSRFSGLGRYVLVTRQPNGNLVFVELKIPGMSEQEVAGVLNQVKDRSKFVKDNKEKFVDDKTENNEGFNADLASKLFVSLPTSGYYIVPSINENGDLVISLAKDYKGKIVNYEKVITNVDSINNIKELTDVINETLAEALASKKTKLDVKITPNNIKNPFSQDITIDEILQADLPTNVAPSITSATFLRASGREVQQSVVTNSAMEVAATAASTSFSDEDRKKARMLAASADEILAREQAAQAAQLPQVQPISQVVEGEEVFDVTDEMTDGAVDIFSGETFEGTPVVSETPISVNIDDDINNAWKKAYSAAIGSGSTPVEALKIADADPKVLDLKKQKAELLDSAEEDIAAFKVGEDFTPEDEKSMLDFLDFVKKNLPDYFVVEQIETLEKNLKTGVITLGKFYASIQAIAGGIEVNGIIKVSSVSPFKYHEAFHGLFRLLLTEEQIKKLLASAKREKLALLRREGKSVKQAIEDLRLTNLDFYSKFTDAQMEDLLYEEYLADAFESWKKNKKFPTDAAHKNWFNRLVEWVRMVLGLTSRTDIVNLFKEFDAGKYANSPVANNRFTKNFTNQESTVEAFKQIMARPRIITDIDSNGKPVLRKYTKFFSGPSAIKLIADVTSIVNKRLSTDKRSSSQVIDDVITDYRMLYNLNIPSVEEMYVERFGAEYNSIREEIKDLEYILSDEKEEFKEAILAHIESAGYTQRIIEEENEEVVDNEGNGSEEERITKRGGMSGLSSFVRTYLSSITRNSSDQFGNTEFIDGSPMVQSVDIGHVYNGLLNALAGQVDQKKALLRMVSYSEGNPDIEAVVQTFFNDTGITFDGSEITGPTKNHDLFQKVMKAFEQFSINYKFIGYDRSKGKALIYDANRKDRSFVQLSLWKQAYDARNSQDVKKAGKGFNDLLNIFENSEVDFDKTSVLAIIKDIADNSGIHFHPLYIQYSLAAKRVEQDAATPEEMVIAESFSDISPLTASDISEIQRNLTGGVDPFVNVFDETEEDVTESSETDRAGSLSRLSKMAAANSFFDETISSTSWKNGDGETVWNHQYSTYSVYATSILNSRIENNEFDEDSYYENHLLLSNAKFMSDVKDIKLERIDALANRYLDQTKEGELKEGSKELETNRENGKTFAKMKPVEFLATMLSLGSNYSLKSYIKNGVKEVFAKVYHIPSILEASGTANIVSLPIVKYFSPEFKATVEGKLAILAEIKREFTEIQKARKHSEKGIDLIKDYHNGKERGFKFHKIGKYLSPEMISHLEDAAKNTDISFDDAMKSFPEFKDKDLNYVKNQIANTAYTFIKNEAEEFIDSIVSLGGLYKSESSSGVETLVRPDRSFVPIDFVQGHGKDGIHTGFVAEASSKTQNLRRNLYQFYFNDMMNSNSWNQLIKGNQNKNIKDVIAEVKRNKGENAGGSSAFTEVIAPELGINHATKEMALFTINDPQFIGKYASALLGSEKLKDRADAQMWITSKAFRHLKFGFGELDKNFADLLDKIDRGISLTEEEIFGSNGMIQRGTMLNSIKVVYYKPIGDGKYVKTSAFVLTKEFTSTKNAAGELTPLAGYEDLHYLREALESYESKNATISALIPESASKLTKDVVYNNVNSLITSVNNDVAKPNILDMKLMYLQQKNPSNKMQITDPSQNKQIINVDISSKTEVTINGKIETVGELSKRYEKLSGLRYDLKYKSKRNKIFKLKDSDSINKSQAKDINIELKDLYKYAQETLVASGRAAQAEYFELDELGQPKYDHNNNVIEPVFVEMILSYLSKGVLLEKIPGHALTLVSDFGVGVVRRVSNGKTSIVRRNELKKNPDLNEIALASDNYSEQEYDPINVQNVKNNLFIDRLRFDVTEYGPDGKPTGRKYAEVVLPAHFREIMSNFPDGEIPAAIAEMFGVRIPTQDKHSAMFIKVVDFLPAEFGSIIVAPRELVEISGADFDIDKLYVAIKQWYIDMDKNGNQVVREYGKSKKSSDKFKDYVNYILREDKDFKKRYKELYPENKDGVFVNLEIFNATGILNKDIVEILKEMNMPTTVDQFISIEAAQEVAPYIGAINNEILDTKSFLLYNPETTSGKLPSAYQPADISPLTDLLKELKAEVSEINPEIASLLFDEKVYNTSGAQGKLFAYKSNKEGSVGIGPTVNALLQWSFLSKGGKDYLTENFKGFEINGKAYTSYVGRFDNENTRKGFILSTLITAMVDNAKERMADRLGLSIEALGVVSHLVATGVTLKDAVLFVNLPSVKTFFTESSNSKTLFGTPVSNKALLENIRSKYLSKLSDKEKSASFKLTTEGIKNAIADPENNNKLLLESLNILEDQLEMSRYFSAISKIVKLVKGFSPDLDSFRDIRKNIELLQGENSPYNFEEYLRSSDMYSSVVNIYSDMEKMLQTVVLSESDQFKKIKKVATSIVKLTPGSKADAYIDLLEKSLLSFMTIKAYQRSANVSPTLRAALNNNIIYNAEGTRESVINSLNTLRQKFPDNYFINNYLVAKSTSSKGNRTGLDLIESNNWSKLNENQKNKLQLSLLELASDLKSRAHFDKLIAYLMVKDGFQFKSGSFINIVPPVLFSSYFEASKALTTALKSNKKESFEAFYGQSVVDFTTEFIEGFLESQGTSFYIPYTGENSAFLKYDFVKFDGNKLVIDVMPENEALITEGDELVYDDFGRPVYLGEGVKLTSVVDPTDETAKEGRMTEVSRKIAMLTKSSLFDATPKTLIVPSHIKIGRSFYKIKSVKRFGKNSRNTMLDLTPNGDVVSVIRGNKFEYVKYEPKGSKSQFPGGWKLFGEAAVNAPKPTDPKPEIKNPTYSGVREVPVTAITKAEIPTEVPVSAKPIDTLLDKYAISASFDKASKKFVYTDIETGEELVTYSGYTPLQVLAIKDNQSTQAPVSAARKTYSGKLTSLQPNQIFVFGSNPEGRHGAGAAKYAKDNFGAVYGQGEGLQGQSYALPTKDLRIKTNNSLRSISPEVITNNIKKLYEVARQNPTKEFLVSDYSKSNLNGYTGQEMADMFNAAAPIPSNIVFNEDFDKLVGTTQPTQLDQPAVSRGVEISSNAKGLGAALSDPISELESWYNSLSEEAKDILSDFKFLVEDYNALKKQNASLTMKKFIDLLIKHNCL